MYDFFELKEGFSSSLQTYPQIISFVLIFHLYPAISIYSYFSTGYPLDWMNIQGLEINLPIFFFIPEFIAESFLGVIFAILIFFILLGLYGLVWVSSSILMMMIVLYLAAFFSTILNFVFGLIISLWSYLLE